MDHRIVCTRQEPVAQPNDKAHIVQVGIGQTAQQYQRILALAEVIQMMDAGHTFHTIGETSGRRANVIKVACERCRRWIIRSGPDAIADNNLDNLRRCG